MAWQVDGLYFLLTAVSAFFTVLIFALILFLAVKYRRSAHPYLFGAWGIYGAPTVPSDTL